MKSILAMAAKEWAEFRRDKLALSLAFLLPLLTLLLFGYGVRLQAKNVALYLSDADNSKVSRKIAEGFRTSDVFQQTSEKPSTTVAAFLQTNHAKAAIEIPEGFEDALVMDEKPSLKTTIDGSDITTARAAEAAANAAHIEITKAAAKEADDDTVFVNPSFHFLFNPNLKEALFIVPGVFGIILWMYPALLISVGAAREYEQGTIVQLQSAAMRPIDVLAGKSIVYFGIGIVEAVVIAVGAATIFGLRFAGDPTPFIVGSVLYVLGSVFFGLMVGAFTRSQTVAVQATATGGFFPSLLLSGFVYPISNIPFPLNASCALVPATYYIAVCRDAFLRGTGWSADWQANLVLLAFMVSLFALAYFATKQMQEAQ